MCCPTCNKVIDAYVQVGSYLKQLPFEEAQYFSKVLESTIFEIKCAPHEKNGDIVSCDDLNNQQEV
jgi:hypothetical protein